jgi:hypothetical protein
MEKSLKAAASSSPDCAIKKRKRTDKKPTTSAEKGYFELRKEKLLEQAAKPDSRPKVRNLQLAAVGTAIVPVALCCDLQQYPTGPLVQLYCKQSSVSLRASCIEHTLAIISELAC